MVSALAKTRVMKSSCFSSPILHCGKNIIPLKNVLVEAEAELILLNLNIFLFIIQCDERESSDTYQRELFVSRWSTCVTVWVASWTSYTFFFHRKLLLLKRTTDRQTIVCHHPVFGRHLPEDEQSESVTLRKTTDNICFQW